MTKLKSVLPLLLTLLLLSGGCLSVKLENTQRLMDRPDFEDAVRGSSSWVTEALKTITRLEEALEAGQ